MDKLKLYDILQEVVQLKYSLATVVRDSESETKNKSLWRELLYLLSSDHYEMKLIKGYLNLCKLEKDLIKLIKE